MSEKDSADNELSKSELKRMMKDLQRIGETLVSLAPSDVAKIPLTEVLFDAITTAQNITDFEGKRRQMQYIGKLIRHVDIGPIAEALAKVQSKDQVSKATFHHVEKWRDRLVDEGDSALEALLDKFPDADSQHLRQLIRKAQKDKKDEKNSGANTALFRYLRELIEKA